MPMTEVGVLSRPLTGSNAQLTPPPKVNNSWPGSLVKDMQDLGFIGGIGV